MGPGDKRPPPLEGMHFLLFLHVALRSTFKGVVLKDPPHPTEQHGSIEVLSLLFKHIDVFKNRPRVPGGKAELQGGMHVFSCVKRQKINLQLTLLPVIWSCAFENFYM